MNRSETHKIAKEYVLKHRDRFDSNVSKKDIDAAVEKVAKALLTIRGRHWSVGTKVDFAQTKVEGRKD